MGVGFGELPCSSLVKTGKKTAVHHSSGSASWVLDLPFLADCSSSFFAVGEVLGAWRGRGVVGVLSEQRSGVVPQNRQSRHKTGGQGSRVLWSQKPLCWQCHPVHALLHT